MVQFQPNPPGEAVTQLGQAIHQLDPRSDSDQ